MFETVSRILTNQHGWMAMIPLAVSAISSIAGNAKKKKQGKVNLSDWYNPQQQWNQLGANEENWLKPVREAAMKGGAMGAVQDAFNPNPTTTELQGVTGQARQLRNQALNEGVRGGQLKSKLLDINQGAANQRLALMENARQQAAQRGYGLIGPAVPTAAGQTSLMGMITSLNQAAGNADMQRQGLNIQNANQSSSSKGGGAGSLLGQGIGGLSSKGSSKGPVSTAVGGNPTFSSGGSFPSVPFTS